MISQVLFLLSSSSSSQLWHALSQPEVSILSDGCNVKYEICADKKDSDPMRRVIRESIRITNARKLEEEETIDEEGKMLKVINRKGEFFGVKVVRVNFEQE